jgi:hypothetical protein
MEKHILGAPAVRFSSRLQVAAFFQTSGRGDRRRTGTPPPLMVDVRVIIRRHFPIGQGNQMVQKVANDMVLRRQQARKLRLPERVERVLAEDVLPLVEHPFDRGAVVAATEKISKYVAGACSDPRLAKGGAQVLVLLDTFACPVLLRPRMRISSCPAKHAGVAMTMRTNASTTTEYGIEAAKPAEKTRPIGVIGDGRPKQVDKGEIEERWKGWLPWESQLIF